MRALRTTSIVVSLWLIAGHTLACQAPSGRTRQPDVMLHGAGATVPAQLYRRYISDYALAHPDVTIDYQAIGSGEGMKKLFENAIDFGASDTPMSDEQLAVSGEILHVPTAVGGVGITYNLPSLDRPLALDGSAIAGIYLGHIRRWNDPRLTELNPGADLPNSPIEVTLTARSAGATALFTQYLSNVSEDFKNEVGVGNAVIWPVGAGLKGEESLASFIKRTPGTISYVDLYAARTDGLNLAQIRNAAGELVEPSLGSLEAAAASASLPADLRGWIVNAKGPGAYPIAGLSYLLIPARLSSPAQARALVPFVTWVLRDDDDVAHQLGYAHVPRDLADRAERLLNQVDVASEVAPRQDHAGSSCARRWAAATPSRTRAPYRSLASASDRAAARS